MKKRAYTKKQIFILPLFFGIVLIVFGSRFIYLAQATQNWPQTKAVISRIKLIDSISSTSKQKTTDISVFYHYQVKGQNYQSNTYNYGNGTTVNSRLKNRTAAHQWLQQSPYQKGHEIQVFYNPNNPEQAVIKTGANLWTFVPLFIGLGISVLFSFFLWRTTRQ